MVLDSSLNVFLWFQILSGMFDGCRKMVLIHLQKLVWESFLERQSLKVAIIWTVGEVKVTPAVRGPLRSKLWQSISIWLILS